MTENEFAPDDTELAEDLMTILVKVIHEGGRDERALVIGKDADETRVVLGQITGQEIARGTHIARVKEIMERHPDAEAVAHINLDPEDPNTVMIQLLKGEGLLFALAIPDFDPRVN